MFIQNIQGQHHMYCVTKYTCNWHDFFNFKLTDTFILCRKEKCVSLDQGRNKDNFVQCL